MSRCIIIPSHVEGEITKLIMFRPDDMILCADGGLLIALDAGIIPDAVIGDMDSLAQAGFNKDRLPGRTRWIEASPEKDLTDTALCLEAALEFGCDELVLLGGIGGRLDHTIANLQNVVGFSKRGLAIVIVDQNTKIHLLTDDTMTLTGLEGFSVSIFSWTPLSIGVTLSGMAYPLTDAVLSNDFPLGVSNRLVGAEGAVSVADGTLLIICSRLDQTD